MALRRFKRVPENAHQAINAIIINVALPATILAYIHNINFEARLLSILRCRGCFFAWVRPRSGGSAARSRYDRQSSGH
jgi:predicted permease